MQRECVYIEVLTTSQFALSVCSVSSFRIFHDCWNLRILIGLSGPDVSKVLSATVFTENEKETEANIKSNYILSKTEYPSQFSSNNTQWQIVYPPASIVSDRRFVCKFGPLVGSTHNGSNWSHLDADRRWLGWGLRSTSARFNVFKPYGQCVLLERGAGACSFSCLCTACSGTRHGWPVRWALSSPPAVPWPGRPGGG